MFRSPQPGDWAAEDEDTLPLPTPIVLPVTPASALEADLAPVQQDDRSNSGGRFERKSERGHFDREGARPERDSDNMRGHGNRDQGDSGGGRSDRSGRLGRNTDRSGRFDRDTDRSGRFDRDTDRSGRLDRDKDQSGRFDRYKDQSGRFDRDKDQSGRFDRDKDRSGRLDRDNGRYEGGGRADVARWGHNVVDRRGTEARRDLPVEQGFIVSLKESFGFVSSLDRDGDLFFHISKAPVDVQVQAEVEYRVKYNPRLDKDMACHLRVLPKGTIQVEETSRTFFHGIVTRSLPRGASRGYYFKNSIEDLRQREEFGLIDVKTSALETTRVEDEPVEQAQVEKDVEKQTLARRSVLRFTRQSIAVANTYIDTEDVDKDVIPHVGDEVRFQIATHRKTRIPRAVELTITVSARAQLDKAIEATLATMAREEGVVARLTSGGGFIKCCNRLVDVYFAFHELCDEDTTSQRGTERDDLNETQGLSNSPCVCEGDEVSFFVLEDYKDQPRRARPRLTALRVQKLAAGSVSFEQLLRSDVEGVVVKAPTKVKNGPAMLGSIAVVQENEVQATVEGKERRDMASMENDSVHEQQIAFRLCDTADQGYVPHVDDTVVFDEVRDKRTGKAMAVKVRVRQLCQTNRETGVITAMKDEFGFIKCTERASDAFFHVSDVMGTNCRLDYGTEVAFDGVVDTKSTHVRATRVHVLARGTIQWHEVVAEGVEGIVMAVPSSRRGHTSNRGGRGDKGRQQLAKGVPGKIGFVTPSKQHWIDFLPELKQKVDAVFRPSTEVKNPVLATVEEARDATRALRIVFPSTLSPFERAALHDYSDWLGLQHERCEDSAHRELEICGSNQMWPPKGDERVAAAAPELTVEFAADDVDDVRYHPRVNDRVTFTLVLVKRTRQLQCTSIKCVEVALPTVAVAASLPIKAGKEEGVIVLMKAEGFGFIQPNPTRTGFLEENVFFHIKEVTTGQSVAELKEGTEVQYTLYFDEQKMRKRATAIRVVPPGTIKTVVPERVRGIVTKASVAKSGATSRFPTASSVASSIGRICWTGGSNDEADTAGSNAADGPSDEDMERATMDDEACAKKKALRKPSGKRVYLYNLRDMADPAVVVREGDEVEFIPYVSLKSLRAAHVRLVASHAQQGVVTRMTVDHGGVIRLDGNEPAVEAQFTARSVLRGEILNPGDRVECAYRHLPATAVRMHVSQRDLDDTKDKDERAIKEAQPLGQALGILRLSTNGTATTQPRGSRAVNSTLKQAMRQIGANAMVASRMAKGPNGSRGFNKGWSLNDEETETMDMAAARKVSTIPSTMA